MKTKKITLAIAVLVLAILACGTANQPTSNSPTTVLATSTEPFTAVPQTTENTPTIIPTATSTPILTGEQAVATRQASIQNSAPLFLTPENWIVAPQGCHYSMAHLSLTSNTNPEQGLVDGSGNLVYVEAKQDANGKTIWMYHFLTASHLIYKDENGKPVHDKVVVQPLDYVGYGYQYALLNEKQIVGDNGVIQDTSILSIIGLSPIDYQGFAQIGIQNVTPGTSLTQSQDLYFEFGYPRPHHKPQFVISKITNIYDLQGLVYARLVPEVGSSATDVGQSGGAVCNQYGQIVAVHSLHEEISPYDSFSNLLPGNIQDQINQAILDSYLKLQEYGFNPIN